MRSTGILLALACLCGNVYANDTAPVADDLFTEAVQEARQMPRLRSLLISYDGELVLEE